MKREAAVPIDEELEAAIGEQQRRILARWPDGTPLLFPRERSNVSGSIPLDPGTYRTKLNCWLQACEIRDEHGRPVHLTPHQWRHTFACRLKGRGVASDATFGTSREHALPAAQRAAMRRPSACRSAVRLW